MNRQTFIALLLLAVLAVFAYRKTLAPHDGAKRLLELEGRVGRQAGIEAAELAAPKSTVHLLTCSDNDLGRLPQSGAVFNREAGQALKAAGHPIEIHKMAINDAFEETGQILAADRYLQALEALPDDSAIISSIGLPTLTRDDWTALGARKLKLVVATGIELPAQPDPGLGPDVLIIPRGQPLDSRDLFEKYYRIIRR